MKNILDKRFSHHKLFKGANLTRRQALEGLATSGDITLRKKLAKAQEIILGDELVYDDVLYCAEGHCTYRLTPEEKEYYQTRKEFWAKFDERMNSQWDQYEGSYTENRNREMMNVPEYLDYITAFNKCTWMEAQQSE